MLMMLPNIMQIRLNLSRLWDKSTEVAQRGNQNVKYDQKKESTSCY